MEKRKLLRGYLARFVVHNEPDLGHEIAAVAILVEWARKTETIYADFFAGQEESPRYVAVRHRAKHKYVYVVVFLRRCQPWVARAEGRPAVRRLDFNLCGRVKLEAHIARLTIFQTNKRIFIRSVREGHSIFKLRRIESGIRR